MRQIIFFAALESPSLEYPSHEKLLLYVAYYHYVSFFVRQSYFSNIGNDEDLGQSCPSCDGRSDRVQAVLKMTYFCEKGASLERFAQKYAKRSVRTFHLDIKVFLNLF
jgi:hypothetical protein